MKYMGSKNRIAKFILPIMLEEARVKGITQWVEPFVGGGNMIDKVPASFTRIGHDLNPHAIAALTSIRDDLENLPEEVTESYYNSIKFTDKKGVDSLIRFGASFGGKFDGGYARGKSTSGIPRNYWNETKQNAAAQSPNLQGVTLIHSSYVGVEVENSLIYCDPPYKGTTGYKTESFNHDEFFTWCLEQKAKGNVVFVSEYEAPFEEVWRGEVKTNFASSRTKATHTAVEKLFKV